MENEIEILIMDPEASFNNRFMEDPEEMEAFLNDALDFIRNHKVINTIYNSIYLII